MAYLTEAMLKAAPQDRALEQKFQESKASKETAKTVFLSHSHLDKDLVLGLQRYLAKSGYKLYIDWQDDAMPRITNKETAIKIKDKIKNNEYFLMLATKNALQSKWVPWEVGVADSLKPYDKLLVIPVATNGEDYPGREYLSVYKRLELKNGILVIFKPAFETYDDGPLQRFFS
ncbi:MAG: toll/interleukin-1 receptor domain-containing protein [Veillonellaceae bacterium]|nr:toll/interleukin-1 receptor domain-containing protein [Veillonellaceae bacterium]